MWRSYFTGLALLSIYLLMTFRVLVPVLHYRLNYTYMATVLCVNRDKPIAMCNGKCQLNKELRLLQGAAAGSAALRHHTSARHHTENLPEQALELQQPLAAHLPPPNRCTFARHLLVALQPPFHPPQA